MKKKVLSSLFALSLLAATAFSVMQSNKNEVVLNDLALANVEALAFGEDGGAYSCDTYCYEEPGWNCKIYSNGFLVNSCPGYRKN